MDDFAERRRAERRAIATFWQAWQQAQIDVRSDAEQGLKRANALLTAHFPQLLFQAAAPDDARQPLALAVSAANRIAPMALAQSLCRYAPPHLPFVLHEGIARVEPAVLASCQSKFAGAHLCADALQVACCDQGDGLVHLRVFADSDLPPEHSGLHVAAWLLLAQTLGEWDLNVKTGSIEFDRSPPEQAVALPQLAGHFDRFWVETLQHGGVLPPLPHTFVRYTEMDEAAETPTETESSQPPRLPALWIRNESAGVMMGSRQAAWCVRITCEVYDTLSHTWTEEIRQALAGVVAASGGILTTVFSDWTEGRFQVCAAVGEPDAAYFAAQAVAKAYDRIDARADCVFDPAWQHYRL